MTTMRSSVWGFGAAKNLNTHLRRWLQHRSGGAGAQGIQWRRQTDWGRLHCNRGRSRSLKRHCDHRIVRIPPSLRAMGGHHECAVTEIAVDPRTRCDGTPTCAMPVLPTSRQASKRLWSDRRVGRLTPPFHATFKACPYDFCKGACRLCPTWLESHGGAVLYRECKSEIDRPS